MAQLYFKVGSDVDKVIKLREEIERLKSTLSGMDGNTAPATIRAMEVQLAKNTKEMDALIVTAVRTGNEMEHNFKKKIHQSSLAVNDLTEDIIKQKSIIRETQEDVRALSERYAKLGKNSPISASTLSELNKARSALSEQKYALGELQTAQANNRLSVKKLKDEYALFRKEGQEVVNVNNGMSMSFTQALGAIGGTVALKNFATQVVDVRAEMQMLNRSFEVLLGSKEKSDAYVNEIKDYALVSPLSVTDVSKAAKLLLGFNVEAEKTIPIIKSIGDITMGDSQKFGSLTLAFAQTSAAGRLMGQDLNQMINAGFNPLQIMSDKTGKSIAILRKEMSEGAISSQMVADAFASATAEGGKFHGMIERSSDGIRNAQNQLTGAIEETLNSIGESQEGIIKGSYEIATQLVQNYDKVGRVIVGLIATYGAYRTAVMLATAAESGHSIAMLLTRNRILLVRRAQQLLNATMLANPYVAVTALVVGLVAGMWALSESITEAEKAQKRFNDAVDESEKGALSEQRGLAKLKGELAATTKGTDEYNKIRDQIVSKYGKYKEGLQNEIDKVGLLDETYQSLTESIKQSFNARQYDKFKQEQETALDEVMSNNLGKIQDRLYKDLGDEEGSRVYAKIHLALLEGKGLDKEIKATLDEVQDKGTILADSRIDSYIRNVRNAQKVTDEFDKKARVKFGVVDGSGNNDEGGKNYGTKKELSSIADEIDTVTLKVSTLKQELADLRSGKTSAEAGKTVKEVIEGKVKDLKAAEDALSTLTGQTTKETDKLLKTQSDLSRAILESELKLQANRIAIMQNGKDKRVLLADQEYKETLAAIEKERAEYKKGIKESGGKEDPSVLSTFDTREGAAKDKRNTDVSNINKESVKEFADHQKQLSEILLSEEEKRLSSIKERYDKEREWANDQLKTGGMDKEQHEAYTININEAEAQESLKSLLDKYQDYDAKRREIDQRYTEEVQTLSSQRTEANKTEVDAAISEAQKRHKEEAAALNFDEFKDTDLWSKMFGDLDKMALPTLQGILDKAKEVNTSTWSPENIKEYQDAITRLEEAVRTRSPFKSIEADWKKLLKALKEGNKDDAASALAGIDQAVQKINADLKTVAGGIGDIFGDEAGYAAEQVTELTSALGGFVSAASKFASGDIIGGIASVVSSIGSIFSMGKKVKEMNREAREENQRFYDEAKAGEIEYQALLRERLRITQQIGETSLQYFDRLQKELHAQSGSIGKEYEEVWSKLMGEEYISGKGYKHGTWFRKAKTWDEYGSLAGKSYEDIESLYTQNKLTDSAKVLFEQLQKLKEEGADVVDMMDDLNQSMKESWTGTTEDSIAQSILDGIAAGKNGVDDLTTYFRDMMKKAMLQGVNMKYLQEPIKKFYEQFADMSESGGMLTEGEIKQLEEMYQQIVNNAQAQFDNLQKVSGLDFSKEENSDNSLKGAYAKASQESIDLLAGQAGAQRVAIEDIRNNMQPIREQIHAIREMNSKGWEDVKAIRDLTDKVEKNTGKIAEIAEKIDGSMSEIGKDTRRSADALDGGTINAKVKM